jgi:hypothetical protein
MSNKKKNVPPAVQGPGTVVEVTAPDSKAVTVIEEPIVPTTPTEMPKDDPPALPIIKAVEKLLEPEPSPEELAEIERIKKEKHDRAVRNQARRDLAIKLIGHLDDDRHLALAMYTNARRMGIEIPPCLSKEATDLETRGV